MIPRDSPSTPSYPTASLTRSHGMVFHRFSGDPVTRSKRTHPWMSGVTRLVRWLCSSPASERYVKWVCEHSFFPGLRKCTPRQKKGVREPTGCVISKATKEACPGGLAVTGFGKECTLLREGQIPRGSCWTFIFKEGHVQSSRIRWGRPAERQKSEDKGKRPIQRRIAKGTTSRSPS